MGGCFNIYSAARCAWLTRVINAQVQELPLKPHRHQSLLSQLLQKISGPRQAAPPDLRVPGNIWTLFLKQRNGGL